MQRGVLRGKRVVGHIGVDAGRIGGHRGLQVGRRGGPASLGSAAQPDGPRLHIARQRGLAQQLGKGAAGLAAADIHLEQPVPGVHPALHEEHVMQGPGVDIGNAVAVLSEPHRRLQAWQPRRRPGLHARRRGCHRHRGDGEEPEHAKGTHHR